MEAMEAMEAMGVSEVSEVSEWLDPVPSIVYELEIRFATSGVREMRVSRSLARADVDARIGRGRWLSTSWRRLFRASSRRLAAPAIAVV